MIKLNVGLRVATLDLGGWDTHETQGIQPGGTYSNLVRTLSDSLAAFYGDLDRSSSPAITKRLTIVVQSEFGRRVQENGERGTDHGTANPMLVIGGNVRGGVYGNWPGLHPDQRFEGADLAPTTDYRTVLSEILLRRFGNPSVGDVFPGFTGYSPLGLVRGVEAAPVYLTQKPETPKNLRIRRTADNAVHLDWTPAENATGYRLERQSAGSTEWTMLASLTSDASQFDDVSPEEARSSYRIQAANSGGQSEFSVAVTLTEPAMTPLEKWRFQHFGTIENTGIAADDYVLTTDGLSNFTKFALGLNPSFAAAAVSGFSPGRPKTELVGDQFGLVFTRPVEREDLQYEVLYSGDLKNWTAVPDVSEGIQNGMERRRASVKVNGKTQFMQLKAKRP